MATVQVRLVMHRYGMDIPKEFRRKTTVHVSLVVLMYGPFFKLNNPIFHRYHHDPTCTKDLRSVSIFEDTEEVRISSDNMIHCLNIGQIIANIKTFKDNKLRLYCCTLSKFLVSANLLES